MIFFDIFHNMGNLFMVMQVKVLQMNLAFFIDLSYLQKRNQKNCEERHVFPKVDKSLYYNNLLYHVNKFASLAALMAFTTGYN